MMAGWNRAQWSDASGSWGCEAYTSTGQWFQFSWPEAWMDLHITVKELLPIVLGVAAWGRQWAGKTIRCRCDNAAAVAAINSGSSKSERMMHLLRSAFFFTAAYNITVAVHLPGVENSEADALSRNDHLSFLMQNPDANQEPVVIPWPVIEALVRQRPDWTSQNWARLLADCLQRV